MWLRKLIRIQGPIRKGRNLVLKTAVRLERLSGGRGWQAPSKDKKFRVLRARVLGHNQKLRKTTSHIGYLPPLVTQVLGTFSSCNLCYFLSFLSFLPSLPPFLRFSFLPFLSLFLLLNFSSSCSQRTGTFPFPNKIPKSVNHSRMHLYFLLFFKDENFFA